jgi:hypothetical protein
MPSLRSLGPGFLDAMAGADPAVVSRRPEPTVWSALEYACHVRDVLLVQRDRAVLAQVQESPGFARMYRDERVSICRYGAHAISEVLGQLAMAAERLRCAADRGSTRESMSSPAGDNVSIRRPSGSPGLLAPPAPPGHAAPESRYTRP